MKTDRAAYLDELRDLVRLHARAQGLRPRVVAEVLDGVTHDGEGPGSWAGEWLAAARAAEPRSPLDAVRLANLARFPYVDGPARAEAHRYCQEVFTRWAVARGAVRHRVVAPGGGADVWTSGPVDPRRPVLLVVGGIVSIKEQWGQLLPLARRLGMTVAVTEMPGVGSADLPYAPSAERFVSDVLDVIGAGPDVRVLALSFSFTLALHAALRDPRIRAVGTVGGPVRDFFDDDAVWRRAPETTTATWARVLGTSQDAAIEVLRATAVPEERLRELQVPVAYVASTRDEIVPRSEVDRLCAVLPGVHVLEHDDVHGAPHHLGTTRAWLVMHLMAAPGPCIGHARRRAAAAAVSLAARLGRRRGHDGRRG